VATFPIRTFGDPVLKQRCAEVTEIDDALRRLVDGMIQTMYEAPGVGLAANQVGVQKRLFVYDVGDGPTAVINPVLHNPRDEWVHHEGCLSVPDMWWDIPRAKQVRLTGIGIDGKELDIEGDELEARVFQHEVDHLDGLLLLERITADEKKEAMRDLRQRAMDLPSSPTRRAEAH
jgi:peptide deformylase